MIAAGTVGSRRARRFPGGPRYLIGGAALVLLVAAWQMVAASGTVSPRLLVPPGAVAAAGAAMIASGQLWENARVSLGEFAVGFALAIACGVPLGLLMGWREPVRAFLEPVVMALNAMPRLALLPLVIVWLGVGPAGKVAVVFIGAVIPIVINAMAGVRDASPRLLQAARSFGARDGAMFAKVLLPGALPSVLAGVRLATGRAVDGVVIAEIYASVRGVGNLLQTYGATYRTASLFFLVLVVALFGYAANVLVQRAEARLVGWRPE